MFREVLTRLAESASEDKEDMQSYVLEIVLTIESAVDHIDENQLLPSNVISPRKVSELSPLPSKRILYTSKIHSIFPLQATNQMLHTICP